MRKGFTLVELSIVLVIIGLLIGGILVAQSMIGTSRDQSIIRDIGKYQIAIRLFKSKFNYLPGNTNCNNGASKNHWFRGTTVEDWACAEKGFAMFPEMYNMGSLDQKYDASYLSSGYGIDTNPQLWPGTAIPKLANGAAIYGVSTDSVTNSDLTTGLLFGALPLTTACANYNFFELGKYNPNVPSNYPPNSKYSTYAIDAANAKAIDTKMDDGNGSTGYVLADGWTGVAATSCKTGPYLASGNYNSTTGTDSCLMYFCAELETD